MDKIIVEGGHRLNGQIKISGSKNSGLPLMAASLLTKERVTLSKMPDLADMRTMVRLLNHLGVKSTSIFKKIVLNAKSVKRKEAPYDIVRKMRASILVLGPLLARFGEARVSLPGGCAIGARPIDLHIKALEEMGAKIKLDQGYVEAKGKLKGARIVFDQVTVGGTENIMMAATLAKGQTVLENAAREPEITDLANMLRKMGAKIEGDGTSEIVIEGVDELKGCSHTVIPDRIEAATYMVAAAMNRGKVTLEDVCPAHVEAISQKLMEAGADISTTETTMKIVGPKTIKPVDLQTTAFPGFPTDAQAQLMAMMALADGTSTIVENIFENRFMHVPELKRMGANLRIEGHTVVVKGVKKLVAAPVMASDLRASASLVLAALVADGVTEIHRVYHIDRGYEGVEKKLRKLGAKVRRAKVKY